MHFKLGDSLPLNDTQKLCLLLQVGWDERKAELTLWSQAGQLRTAQGLRQVPPSAFWGLRVIRGRLDSEVRLIQMDELFATSGGVKTQVQEFCLSKCIYGRKLVKPSMTL